MEAWELLAKTEHNEVAPAQHELAPIFATANIATDHNQLDHGADAARWPTGTALVCLLHEKPFAGVNGSGKHNNWSIVHRHRRQPAGARGDPQRKRSVPAVPDALSSRRWTNIRICCVCPWPAPGNDHRLGGQRSASRHYLHVSGRRTGARFWTPLRPDSRLQRQGKRTDGDRRARPAALPQGYHRPEPHLALSPSPATSLSSACSALALFPSPGPNIRAEHGGGRRALRHFADHPGKGATISRAPWAT